MQKGKIPKVEEYRNKFAVETHPVEVGIALDLFLFPAGPVPEVFRRLAVGATLEPASGAGAFLAREAGGTVVLTAASGTTSSTT
jgi:hypothetical protein